MRVDLDGADVFEKIKAGQRTPIRFIPSSEVKTSDVVLRFAKAIFFPLTET